MCAEHMVIGQYATHSALLGSQERVGRRVSYSRYGELGGRGGGGGGLGQGAY